MTKSHSEEAKNCVSCNFCAIWNVSRADCVVGQPLARQGSRGRRSNSQNSLSTLLCKSLHNKGSFTYYKSYVLPLEPPFPYYFPLFGRGHLHNHYYSLSSKSPALIVQLYTCAPVRKDQKHAERSLLFTPPRKSKKKSGKNEHTCADP